MTTAPAPQAPLWRTAQVTGVMLAAVLLVGLIWWPKPSLDLLWNIVIPLVPASLLVTPRLWRNVCPLATLNMLLNRPGGRTLTGGALRIAGAGGIVLLLMLVPARRFLFNTNGLALAVTIGAVLLVAVVMGLRFDAKAGFCNAFCPVLPVERLYGQAPLAHLSNPRCVPCTHCTSHGCIDLVPRKSIAHTVYVRGNGAGTGWLATPFGLFAAAFPGFVVGYFTTADAALAQAGAVYLHVGVWSGASLALVGLLTLALQVPLAKAAPVLGATAVTLYYWYAGPSLADALHLGALGGHVLRGAAGILVLSWLLRHVRGS
ncbi:MAG TPA: hypothetical protein VGA37_09860 [Gemmatimonadales bacterium]